MLVSVPATCAGAPGLGGRETCAGTCAGTRAGAILSSTSPLIEWPVPISQAEARVYISIGFANVKTVRDVRMNHRNERK